GIADSPSPTRDASATDSPLDGFDLIHRDALRDIENMTLSQRPLVADAHRMIRDEGVDRVEVGSCDVSGSGSDARARQGIPFDQVDCRPTIYHPGGIFEELSPLPPELLRDPQAQSWGNKFFESARAIAAHSHLRWPDLSRELISRQEAQIARGEFVGLSPRSFLSTTYLRRPYLIGSRDFPLYSGPVTTPKLLDEARKMDGVPDLSALLKGKLQLLSKKSTPANVQASTSSDGDRASKEGAPDLVDEGIGAEPPTSSPKKKKKKSRKSKRRVTEELPLEVSLLSMKPLRAMKEKGGRKRPYEGATSSVDHEEAPAVERDGAAEDPVEINPSEGVSEDCPRKKKRSIKAEPRPSDVEAALVEVVTRDGVSPETPPEKRKVSTQGSDPVTSERSAPDPSARKSSRSEGSIVKRGRIEFPDRAEFSYDQTTPLILNPLRFTEMLQLEDLYFKSEYIDAASSRARVTAVSFLLLFPSLIYRAHPSHVICCSEAVIQLGSSEKLAQSRLKAIERVREEHKKANERAAKEKDILRVKFEELEGGDLGEHPENKNLEEVPGKDNFGIGNTPVREEETENVGIEDPVLVSDSSSEGREDREEEDDRVKETSPSQPIEEDPTAAATEDPVGPSALGMPEEVGQDSAP
ncbi:LOW QUALITY PROTEIN: hypothetical protein HID58_045860, partial [Brassica napus]